MPSWVALATTALSSLHSRIFPLPLLLLSGAIYPALQVFVLPFTVAAALVNNVGIVLQALLLLQEYFFESVGNRMNSIATSNSPHSPTTLSAARLHLENLTTTVYPASLETLWAKQFDPMLPQGGVSQEDADEWNENGRKLKLDIIEGIDKTVGLWIEILQDPRKDYLKAVKDELDRIQAGRPTSYVYAESFDSLDETQLELEVARLDAQAKDEERKQVDLKFEEFLDQMKMPAEARATLDHPSDPRNPSSPTFRRLLRDSFDGMFAPSQGVLGDVNRHMEQLNSFGLGMGAPLEPGETIDYSKDWIPGHIPLMTNHYLRDQIEDALVDSSVVELFPEDDLDRQILPETVRQISSDYLNFFQRAVKLDLQASNLARSIVSKLSPKSTSSSPSHTSSTRNGPSLLLHSPFPTFIKSLHQVLTRSSERWLSNHSFALAAFNTKTGLIAVKKAQIEVEKLEREQKERLKGKEEL